MKSSNQTLDRMTRSALTLLCESGHQRRAPRHRSAFRWAASMHLRRVRQCFLMSLLLCASPFAAHAQWATTETEHDWRLTIAGRPYGLVQRVRYVGARIGGTRRTTIYL